VLVLFLAPSHIYRKSKRGSHGLVARHLAPQTDLRKAVGSFLQRGEGGGARAHSANHYGRPTGKWALLVPLYSGGLPRVPLSLFHVSSLLVTRFDAVSGPFDPCEPESCALIGRQFFSVDHKALTTYTLALFPTLYSF